MKPKEKFSIGILTSPIDSAGIVPLSNLLRVLKEISNEVLLITGNTAFNHFSQDKNIKIYNASLIRSDNLLLRIFKYIALQIKITRYLHKIGKKADCWIFMFGAESQILPAFILKRLNKRVILYFTGSSIDTQRYKKDSMLPFLKIIKYFTCLFSDSIIVYSPINIPEYGLKRWDYKIKIFHEHLIDTNKFSIREKISERENIIGFIGRLSEEKGILNFLESLLLLRPLLPHYSTIIIGDGDVMENAVDFVKKSGLEQNVHFTGWVDHDALPEYLNRFKLLIIPSFTEGLPNIMLEAMACGTPVLATTVGAIPSIIINKDNGFLMENNSPETIKNNIVKAVTYENLEDISINARNDIAAKFKLENKVEKLNEILIDCTLKISDK